MWDKGPRIAGEADRVPPHPGSCRPATSRVPNDLSGNSVSIQDSRKHRQAIALSDRGDQKLAPIRVADSQLSGGPGALLVAQGQGPRELASPATLSHKDAAPQPHNPAHNDLLGPGPAEGKILGVGDGIQTAAAARIRRPMQRTVSLQNGRGEGSLSFIAGCPEFLLRSPGDSGEPQGAQPLTPHLPQ